VKELSETIPDSVNGPSKTRNAPSPIGRSASHKTNNSMQEKPMDCGASNKAKYRESKIGSGFTPGPLIRRLTDFAAPKRQHTYQDTRAEQANAELEFTFWLETELKKVEAFYRLKEYEALRRYRALQEQLVILQNKPRGPSLRFGGVEIHRVSRKPKEDERAVEMETITYFGKLNGSSDYQRKTQYRSPINRPGNQEARKELKYACVEYYRRLEFLRSYIHVNREGFRKITKKFDKITGNGMSHKFMNNQISKSYFGGTRNELDQLIDDTELMVAKYIFPRLLKRKKSWI
jgi:hypothetical protein